MMTFSEAADARDWQFATATVNLSGLVHDYNWTIGKTVGSDKRDCRRAGYPLRDEGTGSISFMCLRRIR